MSPTFHLFIKRVLITQFWQNANFVFSVTLLLVRPFFIILLNVEAMCPFRVVNSSSREGGYNCRRSVCIYFMLRYNVILVATVALSWGTVILFTTTVNEFTIDFRADAIWATWASSSANRSSLVIASALAVLHKQRVVYSPDNTGFLTSLTAQMKVAAKYHSKGGQTSSCDILKSVLSFLFPLF